MSTRSRYSVTAGLPRVPPRRPEEYEEPTEGLTTVPRDVKKAIEHIRAELAQPITVADLTRVCGVAERTLHKHFQAFVGLSPLGYLRRMRLAAVRKALRAPAENDRVTTVAAQYGFDHFGKFSAQYKRSFGELPSTTLRRARACRSGGTGADGEKTGGYLNVVSGASSAVPVSRDKPSLAIFPFHAAIDEPFFADSMADAIACTLSATRSLSVTVTRFSVSTALGGAERPLRKCGARYCLLGRITQAGRRLRVILRLLDAASEHHLWGDSYEGEITDPFGLQDRVTEGALRAILPNIRGAEIELARRKRPQDLDAYGLTMRAFSMASGTNPDAARQALDLLAHAMEIDPDYALPAALAAWCHAQLVTYQGTPAPAKEKAEALRLAHRASVLEVDGDPLVMTARCAVHTMMNDLDTADALLNRALALDPASAWAWERSGWLKTYLGKPELAIRHFGNAIRLAPRCHNAHRFIGIGSAYFEAGHYDQAARWKRQAVLERPGVGWVNRTLAVSYARLGERTSALDSLEALQRCVPDVTIGQVVSAIPFTEDFLGRVAEGLNDLGLPA
jgi:TolB-like protein/AraC-like DNA-binding protein/predicted Zn-dependent protease